MYISDEVITEKSRAALNRLRERFIFTPMSELAREIGVGDHVIRRWVSKASLKRTTANATKLIIWFLKVEAEDVMDNLIPPSDEDSGVEAEDSTVAQLDDADSFLMQVYDTREYTFTFEEVNNDLVKFSITDDGWVIKNQDGHLMNSGAIEDLYKTIQFVRPSDRQVPPMMELLKTLLDGKPLYIDPSYTKDIRLKLDDLSGYPYENYPLDALTMIVCYTVAIQNPNVSKKTLIEVDESEVQRQQFYPRFNEHIQLDNLLGVKEGDTCYTYSDSDLNYRAPTHTVVAVSQLHDAIIIKSRASGEKSIAFLNQCNQPSLR